MTEIPTRLQTPERRFILLGSHGEDRKRAFEKDWQETANYRFDDPKLSAHTGNYGVCGGYGGLCIVDSDGMSRWEELEIFTLIPETFTIESRPGHRQYYLLCKEHFHSGGLYDPEKTEINAAGNPEYAHIGDIKAGSKDGICGGYVVGPGCRHPSGSFYQIVVDAPIAEVSREHLQSIIARFKTSKKVNTNFQKVEEQVKAARQRRYEEKDPLDVLQVVDIMPPMGNVRRSGDELRGDHPVHGSTNGGNYVINTTKNLWHCKRCESGGGAAAAIAVKHGLISCSEAGPGELRGDLFKEVLKIAKEKYGMPGNVNSTGPKADRSILDGLSEKMKDDPGIIYEPEYFQILTEICNTDPKEWVRIKKIFIARKVSVRDFVKEIKEAEEDTPFIETPFIVLEGGKLAEMVANNGTARFAVYDPATKKIEYVPEIMQDGARIIPPTSDEIFQKGYVTLPSEAEEYDTELDLYREIQKFVHAYLEVSPDYESIAAFYPMLTWVHDVMPVIAYLRAKGDWGVGKSRYLDVFRALCYRSISTTGAMSEAPIFRIMDRWKGTLIIDEGDFGKSRDSTAAMEKILVCGFERGKPIIRCNPNDPAEVNFFDPFGPKIIATRYGFRDKALESRCFTEIMKESIRIDVPIQLPYEFEEESRHLRNKLLMYRFRNRELVKQTSEKGTIKIDLSGLPKRIQQAARPLSVILANCPELLATLKTFLEAKSKALVVEASETTEGYLVRVMEGINQSSNDGKIITWDAGFGSVTELIKPASGNYKLTTALVRSRANSLGFKTMKSYVGGVQKRIITCEVPLFERLIARYVPQVEEKVPPKQDDQDDQDDIQGHPDKTLAISTTSHGGDKTAREREFSSGGV